MQVCSSHGYLKQLQKTCFFFFFLTACVLSLYRKEQREYSAKPHSTEKNKKHTSLECHFYNSQISLGASTQLTDFKILCQLTIRSTREHLVLLSWTQMHSECRITHVAHCVHIPSANNASGIQMMVRSSTRSSSLAFDSGAMPFSCLPSREKQRSIMGNCGKLQRQLQLSMRLLI